MPDLYRQLLHAETTLENHFRDMQDLEFTIQEGRLWMLQTRNGKRTGAAMVRIAMQMLQQGLIDEKTALLRVVPDRLNDLLQPQLRPASPARCQPWSRVGIAGLAPCGAVRQIVIHERAGGRRSTPRSTAATSVILLVRKETIARRTWRGMHVAQAGS